MRRNWRAKKCDKKYERSKKTERLKELIEMHRGISLKDEKFVVTTVEGAQMALN